MDKKNRANGLGKPGKAVFTGDQDILNSSVFEVIADTEPETGAFVFPDPDTQDFLLASHINSHYAIGCFINNPVVLAHFEVDSVKMYFNGRPAVGLAISMDDGGNIINLGKALNEGIAKINQDLPLGMEVSPVADQPLVVEEAINEFAITLIIAIAVVLLVCFLSLGTRTGSVVALCIPLVIAGVLIGMKTTGMICTRFHWER